MTTLGPHLIDDIRLWLAGTGALLGQRALRWCRRTNARALCDEAEGICDMEKTIHRFGACLLPPHEGKYISFSSVRAFQSLLLRPVLPKNISFYRSVSLLIYLHIFHIV